MDKGLDVTMLSAEVASQSRALAAVTARLDRQEAALRALVNLLADTPAIPGAAIVAPSHEDAILAALDPPASEPSPDAAWAADARAAIDAAIDALDDAGKRLRHPLNTDDQLRAGDACYTAAARLRELAGA